MAEWDECPECGESNFYEDEIGTQFFDCGFEGGIEGDRKMRCGGNESAKLSATHTGNRGQSNDEVTRYRLALLDAAQAVEILALDMQKTGAIAEFPHRCQELARQLREFAGHAMSGDRKTFQDMNEQTAAPKTGLVSKVRKFTPW